MEEDDTETPTTTTSSQIRKLFSVKRVSFTVLGLLLFWLFMRVGATMFGHSFCITPLFQARHVVIQPQPESHQHINEKRSDNGDNDGGGEDDGGEDNGGDGDSVGRKRLKKNGFQPVSNKESSFGEELYGEPDSDGVNAQGRNKYRSVGKRSGTDDGDGDDNDDGDGGRQRRSKKNGFQPLSVKEGSFDDDLYGGSDSDRAKAQGRNIQRPFRKRSDNGNYVDDVNGDDDDDEDGDGKRRHSKRGGYRPESDKEANLEDEVYGGSDSDRANAQGRNKQRSDGKRSNNDVVDDEGDDDDNGGGRKRSKRRGFNPVLEKQNSLGDNLYRESDSDRPNVQGRNKQRSVGKRNDNDAGDDEGDDDGDDGGGRRSSSRRSSFQPVSDTEGSFEGEVYDESDSYCTNAQKRNKQRPVGRQGRKNCGKRHMFEENEKEEEEEEEAEEEKFHLSEEGSRGGCGEGTEDEGEDDEYEQKIRKRTGSRAKSKKVKQVGKDKSENKKPSKKGDQEERQVVDEVVTESKKHPRKVKVSGKREVQEDEYENNQQGKKESFKDREVEGFECLSALCGCVNYLEGDSKKDGGEEDVKKMGRKGDRKKETLSRQGGWDEEEGEESEPDWGDDKGRVRKSDSVDGERGAKKRGSGVGSHSFEDDDESEGRERWDEAEEQGERKENGRQAKGADDKRRRVVEKKRRSRGAQGKSREGEQADERRGGRKKNGRQRKRGRGEKRNKREEEEPINGMGNNDKDDDDDDDGDDNDSNSDDDRNDEDDGDDDSRGRESLRGNNPAPESSNDNDDDDVAAEPGDDGGEGGGDGKEKGEGLGKATGGRSCKDCMDRSEKCRSFLAFFYKSCVFPES
ncbi:uncharacterized protein DDB_G0290685 [Aplysia californica]|uniref:Uncharacterized protein DDB_G0290685 n=1 Tax=Aplysia californica TaxID=6500 RepID=A0ABM0JR72_APLCA|nr:uncharacterized protein DDB_G0290685 [Aplysia californica]